MYAQAVAYFIKYIIDVQYLESLKCFKADTFLFLPFLLGGRRYSMEILLDFGQYNYLNFLTSILLKLCMFVFIKLKMPGDIR